MDRTHKIACSFVALVSLIGLSACGDPNSVPRASGASSTKTKGRAPKVIRITSGSLGSATTMAVPASMPAASVGEPGPGRSVHTDSGFASGVVQYVADARVPALEGTAPSWSFPVGAKPDKAQMNKLAHAFGVAGGVEVVPAEEGGGWRIGPADGTAPSLIVASDELLSWSINPPYPEAPIDNRGCWGTVTPTTTVAGVAPVTTVPVICEPLPAPKNVPNKDEALAKAKTLFASLGYTHLEYEVSTDPMGASVSGFELLDGVRSPQSVNVGYGENGRVTWAAGILAKPVPGDEYPLIGTTAAIARLNEQGVLGGGPYWPVGADTSVSGYLPGDSAEPPVSGGSSSGSSTAGSVGPALPAGPPTTGLPVTFPPATVPPATVPSGTVPPTARPVAPLPAPPPAPSPDAFGPITDGVVAPNKPTTITLIDARLDLSTVYADDGTVWLLPAYTFTSATGFAVTVIAVPDEFIVSVLPVIPPMPTTTPAPLDPNPPVVITEPSPRPTEFPTPPVPPKPVGPSTTFAPPSSPPPPSPVGQPPTLVGPPSQRLTLDAAKILVGLSEADAAATAKKLGWVMRVTRQDGADQIVTADFSTSRINVAVIKGFVTEILTIG
jgi:hypothetical protein